MCLLELEGNSFPFSKIKLQQALQSLRSQILPHHVK